MIPKSGNRFSEKIMLNESRYSAARFCDSAAAAWS